MSFAHDRPGSSYSFRFPISPARLIATHNPFYAISAALVFYGLRISFTGAEHGDASRLMAGLVAYVVLLATTAVWLRKLGAMWEDLRMLALLVLLLLLGISTTFDQTLLADPRRGTLYYVIGWAFAATVYEGLFYGLAVRLPVMYRLPFHLLLALFFLYPPIVAHYSTTPESPELEWLLFGFPCAAAAILLTLAPAIHRGPSYVANNGTPWGWPFYPAVLFAVLVLGVVGRTYYLCISLHPIGDGQSIFGGYFLVPPLVALSVLGLVAARTSGPAWLMQVVLATPIVWPASAALSHDGGVWFESFWNRFQETIGVAPFAGTLLLAVAFYTGAWLSGAPHALRYLIAALGLTSVLHGPASDFLDWQTPTSEPLFLAAALSGAWGLWHKRLDACLVAAACVTAATATAIPATAARGIRLFACYHAIMVSLLLITAMFPRRTTVAARLLVALLLVTATLDSLWESPLRLFRAVPQIVVVYPAATFVVAASFGFALRDRLMQATAWVILVAWGGKHAAGLWLRCRKLIPGWDAIGLGLLSFLAAVLISLANADRFDRWRPRRSGVEIEEDFST